MCLVDVQCAEAFALRFVYSALDVCIVWISLKMLCSEVLATFADHHGLLSFLTSSQWTIETTMASFQED